MKKQLSIYSTNIRFLSLFLVSLTIVILLPLVSFAETQIVRYGERVVEFSDSPHDRRLKQELDQWYERQVSQDCVDHEQDQAAIEAVKRAFKGVKSQFVYGPKDPYNRREKEFPTLRTRPNPKGEGIVVWGCKDHNEAWSADYRRERFVWLVLDKKVYPLHSNASGAIGRLFDGLPKPVQKRAGLVHTYERGKTILDQLSFEEVSFKRFQAGKGR